VGSGKNDDCEIWKENIFSNEEFYALIAEAMILPIQWEAAKMMIAKFGKKIFFPMKSFMP
jgi:hypothetical protein